MATEPSTAFRLQLQLLSGTVHSKRPLVTSSNLVLRPQVTQVVSHNQGTKPRNNQRTRLHSNRSMRHHSNQATAHNPRRHTQAKLLHPHTQDSNSQDTRTNRLHSQVRLSNHNNLDTQVKPSQDLADRSNQRSQATAHRRISRVLRPLERLTLPATAYHNNQVSAST
jgi:hypothetical protein